MLGGRAALQGRVKITLNPCHPDRLRGTLNPELAKGNGDQGGVEGPRECIPCYAVSGKNSLHCHSYPANLPAMSAQPQLEAITSPQTLTRKLRFFWILPLGQLVLCAALLWPIRLIVLRALHIPIPHIVEQTMLPDCQRWSPKQSFFLNSIIALDIPAGLVQLPYAMNSPTKREWSPEGMDEQIWRAVTWPFLCIPFWWIAGRAIDALTTAKHRLVRPRISLMETAIGSIWVAVGTLLFVSFLIMAGIKRDPELTRIAAAGGLWGLLGALSLIARFRQKRLPRLQEAATATTA